MEYHVCNLSDLEERKPYVVEIDGQEIGVILVKGEVLAFKNHCPHAGGPLCLGEVYPGIKVELGEDQRMIREYVSEDDLRIVCPWHGLEFNIYTRECVANKRFKIEGYETEIKEGKVFVNLKQQEVRKDEPAKHSR